MKVLKQVGISLLASCMLIGCGKQDSNLSVLEDGKYTSIVKGYHGLIQLDLIVEDTKIKDIVITDTETKGIGSCFVKEDGSVLTVGGMTPDTLLKETVMKEHNLNFDVVTGATKTSKALKVAMQDCLEQAGADLDVYFDRYSYEVQDTYEADVIVVGGGLAGLSSALHYLEQGKSVVLLEKNGSVGGNSLVSHGIVNGISTSDVVDTSTVEALLKKESLQDAYPTLVDEVKKDYDNYQKVGGTFDSPSFFALQSLDASMQVGNSKNISKMCEGANEALVSLGVPYVKEDVQTIGSRWNRSKVVEPANMIQVLLERIESYKDQFTLVNEMTANTLLVEEDRVVGVVGKEHHTNTNVTCKGDVVVLATGGYVENSNLMKDFYKSYRMYEGLSHSSRGGCSYGEGIEMAKEVGADIENMEYVQCGILANASNKQETMVSSQAILNLQDIIFINPKGERFVREDGSMEELSLAISGYEDGMYYILKSGYEDAIDGYSFSTMVDNDQVFYDETIKGLAKQLKMDEDVLQGTIDTYNKAVETKEDVFGRTLFGKKLKGPYVVSKQYLNLQTSLGGIKVDSKQRVLDESGQVIEGLYAVGEVTSTFGQGMLTGNGLLEALSASNNLE